jgi:hypothetical protein
VQLPGQCVAERFLLGIPGEGIWLADRIVGARTGTANWYWQLPAELAPEIVADNAEGVRVKIPDGEITVQSNAKQHTAQIDVAGEGATAWHAPGYGTRLPGRRLTLTVPVNPGLMVLTSIGKPGQSASVLAGDTSCGPCVERVEVVSRAWQSAPEIIWHVQTGRGWRTIVAGSDLGRPPAGWDSITGKGDWPAFVLQSTS